MQTDLKTTDTTSGGRVLVVDDDRDFAESLRNLLVLEGYDVEMAFDAEQAHAAVEQFDAQVAILDFRLGRTIGLDLVAAFGRRRPDIVCILATAYADMDTAVHALRQGIYDYLAKPLNTADLLATLDRCFEKIHLQERAKAAEAAERESEKMRALAQLAGGVAHHSNNILALVLGNVERLRLILPDDPATRPILDKLHQAVDRAADINWKLVTFTRQHVFRREQIDLQAMTNEAVAEMGMDHNTSIRIALDLAPQLWPISADRAQCGIAVAAILRNAIDAMPNGGTLTITARNMVASDEEYGDMRAGQCVTLSIGDTGSGMPAEVAERAFEPFFSGPGLVENVGLGLSAAYGFAKHSGGHIAIDSAEGQGTTVTLNLPRSSGQDNTE